MFNFLYNKYVSQKFEKNMKCMMFINFTFNHLKNAHFTPFELILQNNYTIDMYSKIQK